ncbi:uncharacterized protein LOC100570731 isoform X1 [Acyrthosiphon pisum]|uniref:Uncharacterized protein n=1 Tax=Acyrthosiphon pisum TaxID=7029 RepID=A0A8R1W9K6_ACYPI|nr:uncharacterized protein LOC100570731 isoform X1 [Acyrthosiphon pisum]|eukprot:XP_003247670.1 PREDICTED: uncharacterized protein LOC100570731 isoform X1 [Acyrthosiphon pisum]
MIVCKVIFAVAVVFVTVAQIQGKPVSDDTTSVQNSLKAFADGLKSEFESLSKSFEGKSTVSDLIMESSKQFQTAMDTYAKTWPMELFSDDLNEKSEQLRHMVEHVNVITERARGNTEIEKQFREFTKKNIEMLMEQTKSFQAKIAEVKRA